MWRWQDRTQLYGKRDKHQAYPDFPNLSKTPDHFQPGREGHSARSSGIRYDILYNHSSLVDLQEDLFHPVLGPQTRLPLLPKGQTSGRSKSAQNEISSMHLLGTSAVTS